MRLRLHGHDLLILAKSSKPKRQLVHQQKVKLNIPQLALDKVAQMGECWTGMPGVMGSISTRDQINFYYPHT